MFSVSSYFDIIMSFIGYNYIYFVATIEGE